MVTAIEEARKRTIRSFKKKVGALLAILVALLILVGLDAEKRRDDEYRRLPYRVTSRLLAALRLDPELRDLAKQASGEVLQTRYESTAEIFEILYKESAGPDDEKRKREDTKTYYKSTLDSIKDRITAVKGDAASAATLAPLTYAYATAYAQQAADLAEIDKNAKERKEKVRRAFQSIDPERLARTSTIITGNPDDALNLLVSGIFDKNHPLHVVFDVFWYASLIVAVLGLVYLVLVPIYKLLPFSGVEEAAAKKLEELFSRAPTDEVIEAAGGGMGTVLHSGVGVIGAIAISAAAIGGASTNAASSPWNTAPPPVAIASAGSAQLQSDPAKDPGPKKKLSPDDGGLVPFTPPPDPPPNGEPPDTVDGFARATLAKLADRVLKLENRPFVDREARDGVAALTKRVDKFVQNPTAVIDTSGFPTREELDQRLARERLQTTTDIVAEGVIRTQEDRKLAKNMTDVKDDLVRGLEAHAREEDARMRTLEGGLKATDHRAVQQGLTALRPPVLSRIAGTDHYLITDVTKVVVAGYYPHDPTHPENGAIQEAVGNMINVEGLTRTQIEWRLDRAVRGAIGPADEVRIREIIRTAKELVVALGRRPS